VGELVRPRLQLAVGEREVAVPERGAIGEAVRRGLEQRREGARRRGRGLRRAAPGGEQLLALLGSEERQLLHPPRRVGEHAAEQVGQMAEKPLDGGGIEEVGRVLQATGEAASEAVRRLAERERHVEPRRCADRARGPQREAWNLQFPGRDVLHDQLHLEQGVVGEAPLRRQLLDQPLEGQILVLIGGEHGFAHPAEQLAERGPAALVSRQVAAQHQGVDEEPDQLLGLPPVASGTG